MAECGAAGSIHDRGAGWGEDGARSVRERGAGETRTALLLSRAGAAFDHMDALKKWANSRAPHGDALMGETRAEGEIVRQTKTKTKKN